jgi:hypothetical protein
MNVERAPAVPAADRGFDALHGGRALDKAKCIGIGLALGLIFGVALHSYGLGILIGLAIGGGLCLIQRRRRGGE